MTVNLRDLYGPGKLTMAECQVCGWTKFSSRILNKPDEIVFVPLSGAESCDKCCDAYARAPEIVCWVLAVITKHSKLTTG